MYKMRVLTYNVQMLPLLAKWKGKKMNSLLSRDFLEFDIICLQENFLIRSPIFKWIGSHHEMIGFSSAHSPYPSSIKKIVSGGLSIYTRYEIVNTNFHPFRQAMQMDKLSEKGILYAKISYGPGLFMHVFNTHLQAGNTERASQIRKNQLQDIDKFIRQHTRNDRFPIMLSGDFNESVSIIGLQMFRKFATISKPLHTYKDRCLDHIIIQQDRMIMMGHDQKHSFNNFSDHSGISVVTFPS